MRILFIGGTFDDAGGSQSGLVRAFSDYIKNEMLLSKRRFEYERV